MKRKHIGNCIAALVLSAAVLGSFAGCLPQEKSPVIPLTVTLLKVGKADAIIVQTGAHALLIDAGEEDDDSGDQHDDDD